MARKGFDRTPVGPHDEVRINDQIRARTVRVVDANGEQLGVMDIEDGLRVAQEQEMDLVEVAPLADPPVCRIMNYGKYKFQKAKRDRQARSKQKHFQIKEVKLRPKTDVHDYEFKLRNAQRFLMAGHKIKVTLMFRGREMAHTDWGKRVLDRFVEDSREFALVEMEPKLEGRNMSLVLSPRPQPAVRKEGREKEHEAPAAPGAEHDGGQSPE